MNSLWRIGSRFLTNRHQLCNRFGNSAGREHSLTRDWLAKLWHEERKKLARRKRKQEDIRNVVIRDPGDVDASPFQLPFLQSVFSRAVPAVEEEERREKKTARQPPFSQNLGGPLSPSSPEEVNAMNEPALQSFLRLGNLKRGIFERKLSRSIPPAWLVIIGLFLLMIVGFTLIKTRAFLKDLKYGVYYMVKLAPLLARSNLVITRDIEWANIMFAIEQESRYTIVDACYPEAPVGFIYEKSNLIFRQLLRTRRPFTAQIIDALGNEIFTIRRPFWLINSSIYAEVDGKEIGVVHRRWHLWRRIYDLYLRNKQFAVVENPGFWNWTFTLKDENDNVLAQIARDWRGIGFELFTDAGQYVIRFGVADSSPKSGLASTIEELEVVRPLTLAERAVAVALAVSLDSDYFSRRGGWGLPFLVATE